jgi:hypothetical protein
MICISLLALSLFGAEILDHDMNTQDQKITGVHKLSDKEKAALQKWIDLHYQKKPEVASAEPPPSTPLKGAHPTLSENLMNSHYLRLSDGTLWNVRPEDVPIAQAWITPVEIMVSQSSNPFYPYRLTNKVSGTSILVRKVDKLPSSGSPQLAPNGGGRTF